MAVLSRRTVAATLHAASPEGTWHTGRAKCLLRAAALRKKGTFSTKTVANSPSHHVSKQNGRRPRECFRLYRLSRSCLLAWAGHVAQRWLCVTFGVEQLLDLSGDEIEFSRRSSRPIGQDITRELWEREHRYSRCAHVHAAFRMRHHHRALDPCFFMLRLARYRRRARTACCT